MPIPVVCQSCGAKLVAPDAAAGNKVKCKNCQAVIAVPVPAAEEESDFEFVDPATLAPPKPVAAAVPVKPKAKPAVIVEDYDDEDDAPKSKKKSKAALVDDEDDDAPRTSKKAVVAEDDEDDTPRKGKKGKAGKKAAKKKVNPLILVLGGVGALFAVAFLGVMIWYVAVREKDGTAATTKTAADGGLGSIPPKDPLAGWTKHEKPGYTVHFKDSVGPAKAQSGTQQGVKVEGLSAGEGPGSKNGFLMVTTEFPPNIFAVAIQNPRKSLEGGINGMKRDGKVLSEKDITVDGNPGREVRMQQKDGSEGIMRLVLAHNRLYIFGVIEPGITESSETYKTFFDNVKLKS